MIWSMRLKEAMEIKLRIRELDRNGLWRFTVPEAPALESQLQQAEFVLGSTLPFSYRHFLSHANGWKSFYQEVDLFGVEDLYFESEGQHVARDKLAEAIQHQDVVISDTMLPIAVSRFDADVFVIERGEVAQRGNVSWFSNGLVDTFTNFDEFFASMMLYNKREILDLLSGR